MSFTTAPDFNDGPITAAKLQQLADAINERTPLVAVTTRTAGTSTFTTTEVVMDSVTASLVVGRTYRVTWDGTVQSSVQDGYARARLREDALAGTQMQLRQVSTAAIAANQGQPLVMTALYTALATASKTFVATCVRQAGTGNLQAFAAADQPTYLTVELFNG